MPWCSGHYVLLTWVMMSEWGEAVGSILRGERQIFIALRVMWYEWKCKSNGTKNLCSPSKTLKQKFKEHWFVQMTYLYLSFVTKFAFIYFSRAYVEIFHHFVTFCHKWSCNTSGPNMGQISNSGTQKPISSFKKCFLKMLKPQICFNNKSTSFIKN